MYAWYINRGGHTLDELLNLGYYERMFYIATMEKAHEEDIAEKIELFLKRKR